MAWHTVYHHYVAMCHDSDGMCVNVLLVVCDFRPVKSSCFLVPCLKCVCQRVVICYSIQDARSDMSGSSL